MPVPSSWYHEWVARWSALPAPQRLRKTTVHRLSVLVSGILAARTTVLAQGAAEVPALGLTRATDAAPIERGLRRTLSDAQLTAATGYPPALAPVLDWPALLRGRRTVTWVLAESSPTAAIQLRRVRRRYGGGALPVAGRIGPQNVPQAAGPSWHQVDAVRAERAARRPAGGRGVLVADRADDLPPIVDRLTA